MKFFLKTLLIFCGVGVPLILLLFSLTMYLLLITYPEIFTLPESLAYFNNVYRALLWITTSPVLFALAYGIPALFSALVSALVFWILISYTRFIRSTPTAGLIANIAPILGYTIFILIHSIYNVGINELLAAMTSLGVFLLIVFILSSLIGLFIGWLISAVGLVTTRQFFHGKVAN